MRKKWVIVFMIAGMAAMFAGAGSGFAKTTQWVGTQNQVWSNAGNWTNGVPVSNDIIWFAGGSAQINTINDIVLTGISIYAFESTNFPVLIDATSSLGIALIDNGAASQDITLSGTLALSATAPITVNAGRKVIISSVLGGGANGITKAGAGTLELNAATNTFSGILTINAGTVTLGSGTNPLAAGAIISMGGGKLLLNAGIDASNWNRAVTVTGSSTIETATGGSVIDQLVTVNNSQVLTLQGTQTLGFSTGITGAGGLTLSMTGNPAITISGTAANYTGDTIINSGVLTTGAADLLTNSGTYTLANSANASISTGGAETIGSLAGGGAGYGAASTVVIGGVLTINQTTTTTYSGIISGGHALDKIGVGSLTFGGNNSYTGTTSVTNGTLIVNSPLQVGAGAYTVFNTATLGGTGTINGVCTINSGAFLTPGDGGVGTLTTTKAFNLLNGSTYTIDILNATSDRLVIGGVPAIAAGSIIQLGTVSGTQSMDYTVVSAGQALAQFTVNNTGLAQSNPGVVINLTGVAAPIPTLNEWGLILFAILIATFAIWRIRSRRFRVA